MKRAIILAGGKGTRLAPFTVVFPKPLMPLGDTPILEVVLTQLKNAGFERATLAVGHLAALMQAYFGAGEGVGIEVDYSFEETPLGTAGPLAAIGGLTEPFLVMNGDVLSTLRYGDFLTEHAASGAMLSIATHKRVQRIDFGVIAADGDGRVTEYVEKPQDDYLVSMGVYAFSPSVLDYVHSGETLDFPELVVRLLQAGEHVRSVPFEGYWLDIGRHDDYELAQAEFSAHRAEFLGQEN